MINLKIKDNNWWIYSLIISNSEIEWIYIDKNKDETTINYKCIWNESYKTILDISDKIWAKIPHNCTHWSCFMCASKILKWKQCLLKNKYWNPRIEISDDEFLTCMWWFKNEYINDEKIYEVELKPINL